jgi:hypothetical protein
MSAASLAWPILNAFWCGFADACSIHNVFIFFITSKTIRYRFIQCLILNGVLFVGSIVLADFIVVPFLKSLVAGAGDDKLKLSDNVEWMFSILYQVRWLESLAVICFSCYPFFFLT